MGGRGIRQKEKCDKFCSFSIMTVKCCVDTAYACTGQQRRFNPSGTRRGGGRGSDRQTDRQTVTEREKEKERRRETARDMEL